MAAETASEIVRRLIGIAPSGARGGQRGHSGAQGVTMEFITEPEFWVAILLLHLSRRALHFGVHKKIATLLDARATMIAKELEEARRLRDEAEKVLADYRRKQAGAATEAENIIALAAKEAETFTAETRRSVKEHFDRRMKLAEDKIARAEQDAVREVRGAAVDAAVAAAQALIAAKLTPDRAEALVAESIDTLKSKLN